MASEPYIDRLNSIEQRIRRILADHRDYRYTPLMDSTAKAFLDLALEYQGLEDFNYLAVLIPKVVLGWQSSLYLDENGSEAGLVASTDVELLRRRNSGEKLIVPVDEHPVQHDDEYLVPLRSRQIYVQNNETSLSPVVGMLSVTPGSALDEKEVFFLRKYADIVAMSLVQRILIRRNQQHINFIKKLVADIGHNVIVPNIFFKAYLRRLSGKIDRLKEIQESLVDVTQAPPQAQPAAIRDLAAEMANANEGLQEEFDHIQKHYVNTSLFLETLLRQSHFEQGQYVLKKKTCNFRRDIIAPQVERYEPRIRERGIEIDLSLGGVPDEVIEAVVDVGLISQVFANFLTNAIKYTRPVNHNGTERKFIAYGLELVRDAFGQGADGVKINLFSTGRPLDPSEWGRVFNEGYRGHNVESERGTGHGLFFAKEVVELHGGKVGYEPTAMGNNFYFILPK